MMHRVYCHHCGHAMRVCKSGLGLIRRGNGRCSLCGSNVLSGVKPGDRIG